MSGYIEPRPEADIPPLTFAAPPREPSPEPEPDPWVPTDVEEALTAAEFALGHLGTLKVFDHQVDELRARHDEWVTAAKVELQMAIDALKRAGA